MPRLEQYGNHEVQMEHVVKTYRAIRQLLRSPGQIETDILGLLRENPTQEFSGADIWKQLMIVMWRSYPALRELENSGKIKSRWADGPYPRKRLYQIQDDV